MLALVSPAKKLDFSELPRPLAHSQPDFLKQAGALVKSVRTLSRSDLQRLMKLSDSLADLNYKRFKAFSIPAKAAAAKQAALAFHGDTYVGLDASSLDSDDLAYAQDHLRILSGLYGLLRPLDLIQPYRLEMGSRLNNPRGPTLYDFWGDDLAGAIDKAVAGHPHPVIINLASNEYFKAARAKALQARVITPVFREIKNGESRVIGMFAKQARGMKARYMIEKRIEKPEGLKKFTGGGYVFRKDLREGNTWIFTRGR